MIKRDPPGGSRTTYPNCRHQYGGQTSILAVNQVLGLKLSMLHNYPSRYPSSRSATNRHFWSVIERDSRQRPQVRLFTPEGLLCNWGRRSFALRDGGRTSKSCQMRQRQSVSSDFITSVEQPHDTSVTAGRRGEIRALRGVDYMRGERCMCDRHGGSGGTDHSLDSSTQLLGERLHDARA
jgi:hypothetical protein